MTTLGRALVILGAAAVVVPFAARTGAAGAAPAAWNARAAAAYLDGRLDWWSTFPNAARDHDTYCVSCHTAAPVALGRPALRQPLNESAPSAAERKLYE